MIIKLRQILLKNRCIYFDLGLGSFPALHKGALKYHKNNNSVKLITQLRQYSSVFQSINTGNGGPNPFGKIWYPRINSVFSFLTTPFSETCDSNYGPATIFIY